MCRYRKEWNDFKFEVNEVISRQGRTIYTVTKLEGNWPNDEDLITLCDGSIPPHKCHFGGKVEKFVESPNKAIVQVYID